MKKLLLLLLCVPLMFSCGEKDNDIKNTEKKEVVLDSLIKENKIMFVFPQNDLLTSQTPPVTVHIKDVEDNKLPNFYIDSELIIIDSLENILRDKLNSLEESDRRFILYTDKTVDIEYVVKVMDIAIKHNFKIILATSLEEENKERKQEIINNLEIEIKYEQAIINNSEIEVLEKEDKSELINNELKEVEKLSRENFLMQKENEDIIIIDERNE